MNSNKSIGVSSEKYIQKQLKDKVYKLCPFCGIVTEKISGCNYLQCPCKGGFKKKGEWCWICEKGKYLKDGCNDKSHNSH